MKLTIEMTNEDDIRDFIGRMFGFNKPADIKVYAAPTSKPDTAQDLPEGFMPAPKEVPFEEKKSEPDPAVSYEMVQQRAIVLVQAQKQKELQGLLQKHGLQALPELKAAPEKLAAFYKDMEVI